LGNSVPILALNSQYILYFTIKATKDKLTNRHNTGQSLSSGGPGEPGGRVWGWQPTDGGQRTILLAEDGMVCD